MPDYKTMYFRMAAKVADAIELLTEAQLEGEKAAMEPDGTPLVLPTEADDKKTNNAHLAHSKK